MNGIPRSETYLWTVGTEQNPISGGINTADLEYMLRDNQSPKMLNLWYDGRVLAKRPGQRWERELAADIVEVCEFRGALIAAAGTALYRIDAGAVTAIFEGLTAFTDCTFFQFNGRLYFINGHEYIVYDGAEAKKVVPYIPTLVINRPPNGEGGSLVDNYNRLGAGFKNSFNGSGTDKVYTLTDKALDAVPPTIIVDGVALVSGFAFDNVKGTVTFDAPPAKGTNNVEITAYKTSADTVSTLLACTIARSFGGENETRVFFAGNGTSTFYYSDVIDPAYFPENNYNVIGDNSGEITGMAGQYGALIFFLAGEIWQTQYSFDGVRVHFPLKAVNRTVGCDVRGSIQLINNSLVFANSRRGVFVLRSTAIADERNVMPISRNIDGELLGVADLKTAVSADWRGKYILCAGGRAWLWDYAVSPYAESADPELSAKALAWFYFEGLAAKGFVQRGETLLFYAGKKLGSFAFGEFRDFGAPFTALWRMPIRSFNVMERLKTVVELWITVRTDTNAQINIKYITEAARSGESEPEPIIVRNFGWRQFAWDCFSFGVEAFAKTFRRKPKKKKIRYFAVELENSEAGRDMSISGIALSWRVAKKIK